MLKQVVRAPQPSSDTDQDFIVTIAQVASTLTLAMPCT